jgi:hypothetical protein
MVVADQVEVPPRCAAISATAEAQCVSPCSAHPALGHHPLWHSVARRSSGDAHAACDLTSLTLARHHPAPARCCRGHPHGSRGRHALPCTARSARYRPSIRTERHSDCTARHRRYRLLARSRLYRKSCAPRAPSLPPAQGKSSSSVRIAARSSLAAFGLRVRAAVVACSRATSQTNQTQPRLRRLCRLPACRSDRSSSTCDGARCA